jgi:hypothetical protein
VTRRAATGPRPNTPAFLKCGRLRRRAHRSQSLGRRPRTEIDEADAFDTADPIARSATSRVPLEFPRRRDRSQRETRVSACRSGSERARPAIPRQEPVRPLPVCSRRSSSASQAVSQSGSAGPSERAPTSQRAGMDVSCERPAMTGPRPTTPEDARRPAVLELSFSSRGHGGGEPPRRSARSPGASAVPASRFGRGGARSEGVPD